MTKIQSAIQYFDKKLNNFSGNMKTYYDMETARQSLHAINDILYIMSNLNLTGCTFEELRDKINEILCKKY